MNSLPNVTFFSKIAKTSFLGTPVQNPVSWGSGNLKGLAVPTLSHFRGLQPEKSKKWTENLAKIKGFGGDFSPRTGQKLKKNDSVGPFFRSFLF